MENPSVLINEVLCNVPQAVQGSLPNSSALKKTIRRKRNQISASPPNPVDLNHLAIPDEYSTYKTEPNQKEDFLLKDRRPSEDRILLFGRRSWLQHLVSAEVWYVDGTFKIAPTLFSQVYIVMAQKIRGVIPVLYAILPNKRKVTYSRLFKMIKECQPTVNPKSVVCDFEIAAFLAIKENFPQVELKGCFFHFSQNMQKHIAALGLSSRYNNDSQFSLQVKMILALAFVPVNHIDSYIDVLADELSPEHVPILNWLEDNYIGRLNRRGNSRRAPLFPLEMWNLYFRTLNHEDKTNNHAEGANRRLQMELGMEHPTLWKFINALKKVQKGRDFHLESLIAGSSPPAKSKKYRDTDSRILSIVQNLNERTPIEYLRGISHNIK
ncbi:uncharacterized protein [Palaemon carinicauda]|uniref:uncharacterized protein n=1 Tax=Palaemon carinicauda TaxID=392227 RepID=UPI0035B62F66